METTYLRRKQLKSISLGNTITVFLAHTLKSTSSVSKNRRIEHITLVTTSQHSNRQ